MKKHEFHEKIEKSATSGELVGQLTKKYLTEIIVVSSVVGALIIFRTIGWISGFFRGASKKDKSTGIFSI